MKTRKLFIHFLSTSFIYTLPVPQSLPVAGQPATPGRPAGTLGPTDVGTVGSVGTVGFVPGSGAVPPDPPKPPDAPKNPTNNQQQIPVSSPAPPPETIPKGGTADPGPTFPPTNNSDSGISQGAMAGIIIGVLAGVLFLLFVGNEVRRRKQNQNLIDENLSKEKEEPSPVSEESISKWKLKAEKNEPSLKESDMTDPSNDSTNDGKSSDIETETDTKNNEKEIPENLVLEVNPTGSLDFLPDTLQSKSPSSNSLHSIKAAAPPFSQPIPRKSSTIEALDLEVDSLTPLDSFVSALQSASPQILSSSRSFYSLSSAKANLLSNTDIIEEEKDEDVQSITFESEQLDLFSDEERIKKPAERIASEPLLQDDHYISYLNQLTTQTKTTDRGFEK